MVGMMVRQKHPGDIAKWNSQLVKSLHSAAPGIEDELLFTDFDQRARTETLQARRRRAGAEQRNPK